MKNENELVLVKGTYEIGKSICSDVVNMVKNYKEGKIRHEANLEILKRKIEFEIKEYLLYETNKLRSQEAKYIRDFCRTYINTENVSNCDIKWQIRELEKLVEDFDNILN